ncbi:hypothetical protein BKA62DRAFT_166031 [Auriculariales sp. MPI-PUGE-AT-0066]|nr:hypothetical protein BKA62DRAFT_166031 [Auriculariales sp. MPI-PUGE-AT-0066]
MRSFILVALVASAAQLTAAHVPRVPHRGRHAEVARELADSARVNYVARAPTHHRRGSKRCPVRSAGGLTPTKVGSAAPTNAPTNASSRPVTAAPSSSSSSSAAVHHESSPSSSSSPASKPPKTSTKTTQSSGGAVNAGSNPTSTTNNNQQGGGSGPTKTQNLAAPSATRTSAADPFLNSLSNPLKYALEPFFTETHSGDMTFYAQGQTACGDVYDDSTLTAAVSHEMYDNWAGASGETNRNPICGPWVEGRYFLSSSDEVVPGKAHAVLGGDGLLNCFAGEQCHRPLSATVHNPMTGLSVKVHIVDRCADCKVGAIDLAPAAFLKVTRPDLDLSKLPTSQLMLEALKDHYGRIPVTWTFDQSQSFGSVVSV